MFQLTADETKSLRLHFATSNTGRGGRRYFPYVFTEYGAVMLSSVLNTLVAVETSVKIWNATADWLLECMLRKDWDFYPLRLLYAFT